MIEISIIAICLILNAVLSGAETAFIAVSRPTLKELAKKGNKEAKLLLLLRESPERTLSVVQIGITFVGALAAAVGGASADEFVAPWMVSHWGTSKIVSEIFSILFVVIPLTYISVVIGELVPKTLALRRPLFLASKAAPWLYLTSRILGPIATIFELSTKKIVHLFPKKHIFQEESHHNESSMEKGIFQPENRQYVVNILKIETTIVEEIMVEWNEVVYVEMNQSIEEVESLILSSGHTRLPVVRDHDVIGIIHAKEFFSFQKTGQKNWPDLLRPALKISHNTYIISVLQLLQQEKMHMAIVYKGSTQIGIVTMESIFEEIIGEIYDEDDDGTLKRMLNSMNFKKQKI